MAQPPADIQAQAPRNTAIAALATQQLGRLWPQVDWASPAAMDTVKTIYRAVVTRFGQAAATVAADFYDSRRAGQGLVSQFRAVPADPTPQRILDAAVENAFKGEPNTVVVDKPDTTSQLPVGQRVSQRLDDSVGRHVLQAGRDTTVANTAKDPAKPRYIRVPTGEKTCAFCVMLASRQLGVIPGPQKRSFGGYRGANVRFDEETQRLHVFAENGQKYHDHCDCEAVPVFPGENEFELSPNMADYQDMYRKAAADAGTHRDMTKILASMRQLHGLK